MNFRQLIALSTGFNACLYSFAQFSTDFTAAEGYSYGDLVSNPNWNGPSGIFMVDPSGDGTVTIDPQALWQATAYVGSGSRMSTNNYSAASRFTLDFASGAASTMTGAQVLGLYEFRNKSKFTEYSGFGLRQTDGAGTFNMFVINTLEGSNATAFSLSLIHI